jgi:hypothetical protein
MCSTLTSNFITTHSLNLRSIVKNIFGISIFSGACTEVTTGGKKEFGRPSCDQTGQNNSATVDGLRAGQTKLL